MEVIRPGEIYRLYYVIYISLTELNSGYITLTRFTALLDFYVSVRLSVGCAYVT